MGDMAAVEVQLDSLFFEAVLCERESFEARFPLQKADALKRKSELCLKAGKPGAALEALERVPMFALSPEERHDVTLKKASCAYLSEDCDAALSYLAEAGVETPALTTPHKSEALGMALGFIVPAGYAYAGATFGETLLSTLLNAASLTWTVTQIGAGLYLTGGLGGAIALSSTFLGAQKHISTLIQTYNARVVPADFTTLMPAASLHAPHDSGIRNP